jgi:hypothetical protein
MSKKVFIILVILVGSCIYLGFLIYESLTEELIVCTMEAKQCLDGSYVSRVSPECDFALCPGEKEGILVVSPKTNEKIESPIKIKGEARGSWFFEAQFNAVLLDSNKNKLGEAILTAKSDWMTEDYVQFEGELSFIQPLDSSGILKFLNANPSGFLENQKTFEIPVEFIGVPYKKVSLYYYNPEKDKDESDNIKCSRDGLVVIEREIPASKTPIKDVINLLLKGKENLRGEDIEQGITTEYPLEGFTLEEVNLKEDGTLILKFNDLLNKTSGGSCRAGILWFQIEATAKQFSEVKQVRFLPEEIFQP